MKELDEKDVEYALACLKSIINRHGWTQPQLAQLSGVTQSTISKVFSGNVSPSPENLKKLCRAVGLRVADVLPKGADLSHDLCGYLATPLTGLNELCEAHLEKTVEQIKSAARSFKKPTIDLYWPGDYTHPTRNPDFTSAQVYLLDRLRASTNDFVVLLCASPSYGVGQENEISTQVGLPMIRIVPDKVSRMISGSFAHAIDLAYTGSLEQGIELNGSELKEAFEKLRVFVFRHRALYRKLGSQPFGSRLRALIEERTEGYLRFADDLGVSLTYIHVLMDEDLIVSNPSAQLLRKMASLLDTSVGYLLGEMDDADPVLVESKASWSKWIQDSPVEAAIAIALWDQWTQEHKLQQSAPVTASFRNSTGPLTESDWQQRYEQRSKLPQRRSTNGLFQ